MKSVPEVVDNIEHVSDTHLMMANAIYVDAEVAADAANVTVGAVMSVLVTVVVCGEPVRVV